MTERWNTSRWPDRVLCVSGTRREKVARTRARKRGRRKKINPHVLGRTRKRESTFGPRAIWRRYTSENVWRVYRGCVNYEMHRLVCIVPSSDECTSEKPREMFIIGIVGPFPPVPFFDIHLCTNNFFFFFFFVQLCPTRASIEEKFIFLFLINPLQRSSKFAIL